MPTGLDLNLCSRAGSHESFSVGVIGEEVSGRTAVVNGSVLAIADSDRELDASKVLLDI